MSQQHAHMTVFCFSFSAPFSNCWLLWLNFITSYTALTADVFSSVYSLVIPRLCLESPVFSLPGCSPYSEKARVGQKGWGTWVRLWSSSVECPQEACIPGQAPKESWSWRFDLCPLGWEQPYRGTTSWNPPPERSLDTQQVRTSFRPKNFTWGSCKRPGWSAERASQVSAPPVPSPGSISGHPCSSLLPTCLPFVSVPKMSSPFRWEVGASKPRSKWP